MGQAKTTKGGRTRRLSSVNANAAGIDIGSQFHVVAVPADRDDKPVRTFQSFTGDLYRLADWLLACGITTVAMESTGIYWIALYEILEARGITVVVANARDVKHVPGRKTDVNDAQWPSSCTSTACCAAVSIRAKTSPHCGPICASESACWIMPPRIFSICRRR